MAKKQFEKQYEKIKALREWPPEDEYDLYYSHRMVWRAVLEWVLKNYPDDAIYEIIKKELGNGN